MSVLVEFRRGICIVWAYEQLFNETKTKSNHIIRRRDIIHLTHNHNIDIKGDYWCPIAINILLSLFDRTIEQTITLKLLSIKVLLRISECWIVCHYENFDINWLFFFNYDCYCCIMDRKVIILKPMRVLSIWIYNLRYFWSPSVTNQKGS